MAEEHEHWRSWRLYGAREGDKTIVGSYGGHPRGVQTHEWPRCAVCSAPMCYLGQINAGPWLHLGQFGRMSLFICHATGGRCEDWDADKGANRVLLQTATDTALHDGPPTVRVYRRKRLVIREPTDELALMRRVHAGELEMKDALRSLRHDKLGGGAVWLTGDATPKSKINGEAMRLALQFTTDLVHFDVTDRGIGYVFVDPADPSPDSARFLWQGT